MDRGASGTRILAASGVLLAAYVLLLTALSSRPLAWVTGFVKGAADACAGISLPFLHAQRFGRRHNGAIFAANRALGVVGSGLGPLLFGVARDRGGSFVPALRVVALLPALCAAAAAAAPLPAAAADAGAPRAVAMTAVMTPARESSPQQRDTELTGLLAAEAQREEA
jgi:predicted MFS family arabinose efflux permease